MQLCQHPPACLQVTHVFGDHLWSLPGGPPRVPNDGFFTNCVVPVDADPKSLDDASSDAEQDDEGQDVVTGDPWGEEADEEKEEGPSEPGEPAAAAVADLSLADAADQEEGPAAAAAAGPELTTEEMDDLLRFTLLQCLHTVVIDKDLPLPCSALWSKMLQARPPGE